MSVPSQDIPYVAPTLKAVFADAVAPASFAQFLKLAIPGGLMMQIEGNSFDITNVLASLLGARPFPGLRKPDPHNSKITELACIAALQCAQLPEIPTKPEMSMELHHARGAHGKLYIQR